MMNIQRFTASTGTFLSVKEDKGFIATNLVAVNATDGIKFDTKGINNDSIVLIAQNADTSAKNVVVKAPTDGGYAAADEDLTLSLAASGIAVARISTAKYANNDGSVIVAGGSANVKVQCICR